MENIRIYLSRLSLKWDPNDEYSKNHINRYYQDHVGHPPRFTISIASKPASVQSPDVV